MISPQEAPRADLANVLTVISYDFKGKHRGAESEISTEDDGDVRSEVFVIMAHKTMLRRRELLLPQAPKPPSSTQLATLPRATLPRRA